MTFLASDIFQRVSRVLLDETNVRWPLEELRLWLNDGLREIALVKPTATSDTVIVPLVAGTFQEVSNTYISVLRVTRNLKSGATSPRLGAATVRVVDRQVMDAQAPDWHDSTRTRPNKIVRNVVFDIADPRCFWVYPPNDGTGYVEAIVSKVPSPVPAPTPPADQKALANYAVTVDLLDIYANALTDYILYRAYSKDAAYTGSAQRAAAHYAQMAAALGVTIQNDLSVSNMNAKPTVQSENAA